MLQLPLERPHTVSGANAVVPDDSALTRAKTARLLRVIDHACRAKRWRERAIRIRQRAEVRYRAALRAVAEELLR